VCEGCLTRNLNLRRFDAVIHFAGRKAVGESVEFPMLYYTHNVLGAVNLIEAMRKHNIKKVGFPPMGFLLLALSVMSLIIAHNPLTHLVQRVSSIKYCPSTPDCSR
jgi:hypothetical protein